MSSACACTMPNVINFRRSILMLLLVKPVTAAAAGKSKVQGKIERLHKATISWSGSSAAIAWINLHAYLNKRGSSHAATRAGCFQIVLRQLYANVIHSARNRLVMTNFSHMKLTFHDDSTATAAV